MGFVGRRALTRQRQRSGVGSAACAIDRLATTNSIATFIVTNRCLRTKSWCPSLFLPISGDLQSLF
jgi:hypothetical protein